MIDERLWEDIKQIMTKPENKEKYEAFCKSTNKEDERIKFYIKRIKNYFELEEKYKEDELNKNDCVVSIRRVNQYFKLNDWK